MTKMCASIVMGAALILGAGAAGAADLNGGKGGLKDYGYAAPMPVDSPARWYVRIDGGYATHDEPVMVLNTDGAQYDYYNTNIDSTWTVGGGLGLYVTSNVRADVTVDHRFQSDVTGSFQIPDCGGCTSYRMRSTNGLESTVALVNVYYDFDTRSRFTPYIGVGLGAVHHSVKAGVATEEFGRASAVIDGKDNWHVAGALMAGFSVALRERLHFDAGYRFLYLGETATGDARITLANGARGDAAKDPTIEDLHAHEFRFGLRYDIR